MSVRRKWSRARLHYTMLERELVYGRKDLTRRSKELAETRRIRGLATVRAPVD
jgi:hypothetical protein